MGQGQTVMTGVVMVVVVSLITSAILWIMPLYKHYTFSHICRNYGLIVELDNGLSEENRRRLESDLNKMGMESIIINVPNPYEKKFKTSMPFIVKGTYRQSFIKALFESDSKEMLFVYETEIWSRKISN